MVQFNIIALMHLTRLFLPNMMEKKQGKILNVSSTAWMSSGPKMSVYYASKAFVTRFSDALQEEVKPYNIAITTLCPPSVPTNFQATANMKRKRNRVTITATDVAQKGYEALMKNKGMVYCDASSYLLSVLVRLLPNALCRKVILWMNKE